MSEDTTSIPPLPSESSTADTPLPPPSTPTRYDEMEDILVRHKPNEKSCRILLDPAVRHRIEKLEEEHARASQLDDLAKRRGKSLASTNTREVDRIEDALREAYAEMDAVSKEFVFRDIGNKMYDIGINLPENRPSKEQIEQWREAGMEKEQGPLLYNTDNFPVWLISKCSLSPKISMEQARVIYEEWGEGDVQILFLTAIAACKERTSIPFGRRDFAKIPDSDSKSLSAETLESPTQTSSDGLKTTG